jgi:hypothetical protein
VELGIDCYHGTRLAVLSNELVGYSGREIVGDASACKGVEANFSQFIDLGLIMGGSNACLQSFNTDYGAVNDSGKFRADFLRAAFAQALFCFARRKPRGISIGLLRRFQPGDFTEISNDSERGGGRARSST